jgi:TetR/AcrR family transcriptional repressor of uid operon
VRKVDPERVAQQRDAIIQGALRCFARLGVQKSTTDDICREAGISPGRLYYYFPSKDAIIEAVVHTMHDYSDWNFADTLAEGDVISGLLAHLRAFRVFMTEQGLGHGLIFEIFSQMDRAPAVKALVQDGARRRISEVRQALTRRKQQGVLPAHVDVEGLTSVVVALMSGIEILVLTDPDYDAEHYERSAEAMLRHWVKG